MFNEIILRRQQSFINITIIFLSREVANNDRRTHEYLIKLSFVEHKNGIKQNVEISEFGVFQALGDPDKGI